MSDPIVSAAAIDPALLTVYWENWVGFDFMDTEVAEIPPEDIEAAVKILTDEFPGANVSYNFRPDKADPKNKNSFDRTRLLLEVKVVRFYLQPLLNSKHRLQRSKLGKAKSFSLVVYDAMKTEPVASPAPSVPT